MSNHNTTSDRAAMMAGAKAEYEALRAWQATDGSTPRPDTPILDNMQTSNASGGKTMTKKSTTPRVKQTVQFYKNGRPLGESYNTMAHLALQSTKGVPAEGDKLNSKGLRELLAAEGITEPTTTTWALDLTNGVTIGAVAEGDEVPEKLTEVKGRTRQVKSGPRTAKLDMRLEGSRTWIVTENGEDMHEDGKPVKFRSRKAAAAFIDERQPAQAAA